MFETVEQSRISRYALLHPGSTSSSQGGMQPDFSG